MRAHHLLVEPRPSSLPTDNCSKQPLTSKPPSLLLLFLKCKCNHVSSLLKILHSLPITFRIKANLFGKSHKVLCDLASVYHSGLICGSPTPAPHLTHDTLALVVLKHLGFPGRLGSLTLKHLPLASCLLGSTTHPLPQPPAPLGPSGRSTGSPLGAWEPELDLSTHHTAENLSFCLCQ